MPASHKGYKNKLLRTVKQTITTYGMLKPRDSVLIGVSGGPDSVALFHLLLTFAPRFSLRLGVAHLNHCLRQDDSDKDAEFVASLAGRFGIPCYIHKINVRKYQIENKLSLEEAARRVRHSFLNHVAEKNRFNKIALGHHFDDNAELVLMNLFRGSGPLGISAIPPVRNGKIIRPLLQSNRSEIITFLDQNGLKYVSDPSNRDTRFLRNRIRHDLIPLLKTSYNPKISQSLNRLASIIRSEEEWIEGVIHPLFEKAALSIQDGRIALSVSILNGIHVAAQRRIIRKAISKTKGDLRRIRLTHIDSAINLLEYGPDYGNIDLPDRVRIQRKGDVILFFREKSTLRNMDVKSDRAETLPFEYPIAKPESLFIKEISAHVKFTEMCKKDLPDLYGTGQNTGFFDRDALSFPLVLRNFRHGDRFAPLGMTGTQKIKKFFIDKKVPRKERTRCPILLCRGKIIWVAGYRIDDSVKVKSSTKNVLKIELSLA
ncbi:MAG: tRNA(Ile)-lysidine synthase [Desulfobacteraceae bacterium Eth-SRB2]|nr:MAG: tRNA(Ile)-lysidine synthase [Desulfobacteraceae bacterium Eth-SRB2]